MKQTNPSGALKLVAFTVAIIAGPFTDAFAEPSGWYGGINLGQSRAKVDDVKITSGLLGGGFSSASITNDERDTGYKVFGGYQINKNFALEGGFFDLGKFGFTATTVPLGTLTGTIKVKGINLDLVGMLPISEKFSAFGRIGLTRAKTEDTFTGSGLVRVLNPNPRVRDSNAKVGLGLQYAFTDSFGMRAEVERYRVNDAVGNRGDIDLVSLGLVYRFGTNRPTPTYVARATAPEPAAPAVAPAPVVAAPAAAPATPPARVTPPQRLKVKLSADALFDFDQATIKSEGKQRLDKFVADLSSTTFEFITVTGHTDRFGTEAYNLRLSTRRADAVKNYLSGPAAIPAVKITATGAGESQPLTKPDECRGQRPTKALIACLQPDRRVELEVLGTKY